MICRQCIQARGLLDSPFNKASLLSYICMLKDTPLQRWAELEAKGYVAEAGLEEDLQVDCLESWWRNKAADLKLVAALQGRHLQPEESLQDAMQDCITRDSDGRVHLKRSVKLLFFAKLPCDNGGFC